MRHPGATAVPVVLALALAAATGCPAHTDYNGAERLTDHTAYTLGSGETLLGIGAGEADRANLLFSLRAEHAFFEGFEVGTNVAHDALGVVNAYVKGTPLATRWVALGARVGLTWLNPQNIWMMPAESRDDLGDLDLFMVPLTIAATFPLASWVGLTLEANYTYSGVAGTASIGESSADAGFGGHEVSLRPSANFYVGRGIALQLGLDVPLYASTSLSGYVEEEVQPGVVVGAQAGSSKTLDVRGLTTTYVGFHMAWEHFNLRLFATYGLRIFAKRLKVPIPGAAVFWRF